MFTLSDIHWYMSVALNVYSHQSTAHAKFAMLQSTISKRENRFDRFSENLASVSSFQWDMLNTLAEHMYEWNQKVNIVSRKDTSNLIPDHIVAALSISLVHNFSCGDEVIDVGTGGGLPGLPLAVICPTAKFTLLDSSSKKMRVVQDMVDRLGLRNVRVMTSRAEDYLEGKGRFDFLLGRGVTALPNFLHLAGHLLSPRPRRGTTSGDDPFDPVRRKNVEGGLLYIKGGDFGAELQAARIERFSLHPVRALMPALPLSDKVVLHVAAADVPLSYRSR